MGLTTLYAKIIDLCFVRQMLLLNSGLPALVVKEVLHVCRIGGCAVGYRDLDSGRPYLKPMVIVT